jgi:hypothetical protein
LTGDFWKEMLGKFPDFFFVVAALIVLFILIVIGIWVSIGAKRFADSMGKENRLISLQEEMIKEKEENKINSDIASLLKTVIENTESHIHHLNRIKNQVESYSAQALEYRQLIQQLINSLSNDIKFNPGERHRCGLWVEDEDTGNKSLILVVGSTGFPPDYILNRVLNIDRSIAGNCFRKKQVIKRDNVLVDEDWEKNRHSNSNYTALICVPISDMGVLTIDALKPMKEEILCIAQIYARIIEIALSELSGAEFHEEYLNHLEVNQTEHDEAI